MSKNKPKDTDLYNRVKKIADLIYDKPSAYKSGYIVKTYKKYGGEYEGTKDKDGLDRWFKEQWKDINDDDSLYPTYRPTIRINKNTPITKSELNKYEKERQIKEKQIIKGDRSDGVPNILSDDDIFLRDERQRPINKKRLEEWSNVDNIPLGSETRKYYDRNKKLIDLSMIPKEISESIINKYKDCKDNDRSLLLQYFIDNKLKALIENINDF